MNSLAPPTISQRPIVTIKEACALTHVSRRTLYNWMESGKVTYIRTAGGGRRIYADTLWMREPVEASAV